MEKWSILIGLPPATVRTIDGVLVVGHLVFRPVLKNSTRLAIQSPDERHVHLLKEFRGWCESRKPFETAASQSWYRLSLLGRLTSTVFSAETLLYEPSHLTTLLVVYKTSCLLNEVDIGSFLYTSTESYIDLVWSLSGK